MCSPYIGSLPDKKFHTLSPWLVWLSGLGAGLQTKRLSVWAQTWVAGQLRSWVRARGNQSMFLSYVNFSLPLSLSLPLSVKINK